MKKIFPLLATLSLLGCTMGPDFTPPAPPHRDRLYKRTAGSDLPVMPQPKTASRRALRHGSRHSRRNGGRCSVRRSWTRRCAPPIANNPNLTAAQASLNAAMENVKAQIGAYYPQVTGGLDASRQKNSAVLSPTLASNTLLFNLYQAQLGATWTLDLWGATGAKWKRCRQRPRRSTINLKPRMSRSPPMWWRRPCKRPRCATRSLSPNQMLAASGRS